MGVLLLIQRSLFSGLEMSLIVGIDFTTSNGDPRYDNSLHYHSNEVINDYVLMINNSQVNIKVNSRLWQ